MAGPRLYDTLKQRIAELTAQLEAERKAKESAQMKWHGARDDIARERKAREEAERKAEVENQARYIREGERDFFKGRAEAAEANLKEAQDAYVTMAARWNSAEAKLTAVEAVLKDGLEIVTQLASIREGTGFRVASGPWIDRAVRALNRVAAAQEGSTQAMPGEPAPAAAHTDHPARHWDRTCPACNAEAISKMVVAGVKGVSTEDAAIPATQSEKAAAFEWLRTIALGTLVDAKPAAILLQELAAPQGTLGQFDGKELREAELRGMERCAKICDNHADQEDDEIALEAHNRDVRIIRAEIARLRGELEK